MSLSKIVHDSLSLEGPNSIKIYVKPKFPVFFSKAALQNCKEDIAKICLGIPDEAMTGIALLKKHTEQNEFYALVLMALAKHFGIWDVFPDTDLLKDCDIEYFPFAQRKSPLPLNKKEDYLEEPSVDTDD